MTQINNTFTTTYNANLRFQLAQKPGVLWPLAMPMSGTGEMQLLDNIVGESQGQERKVRNQDTYYGETTHDRVWVAAPYPYEYARLVDSADKVKSGIDLTGTYVTGGAKAINRWKDNVFLRGFFGNMLMGKSGGTIVPFSAANVVPVGTGATGPTGMNVDKIKAARQILAGNYVDMDQPFYMTITSKEVTDLFGQVEVTSEEFKSMKGVLSPDGKRIMGMLGFEFVELELDNPLYQDGGVASTTDGNNYRKNLFWSKDGMAGVTWEDLFTRVGEESTKGYAQSVFARTMVTATRTDNGRCGYVLGTK